MKYDRAQELDPVQTTMNGVKRTPGSSLSVHYLALKQKDGRLKLSPRILWIMASNSVM